MCSSTLVAYRIAYQEQTVAYQLSSAMAAIYWREAYFCLEETEMRSFIVACVVAAALATAGAFILNSFQEPVAQAFATSSVRV
jgi:hypothetical protein